MVLSGLIWVFVPEMRIVFTLMVILPWGLRLLAGKPPFQRTPLDLLVALLVITAWVGYWAAYDKESAWVKVWLIVTAVLLYYAISGQPKQNLVVLSLFSFLAALAISIYFFLSHDFSGSPNGISSWWISTRPALGWPAIHHGYISGLLVITSLFALYWIQIFRQGSFGRFTVPLFIFLAFGGVFIESAFLLTVSRGVWLAIVGGLGVWIIWKITASKLFESWLNFRALFPLFVLVYMCLIMALAYLGPAQAGQDVNLSKYGSNARAELFERGAYFLRDYPITGGGLNSFPGLYSQYMLGIPVYYFLNSYNIFLDVAIEQGVIGGLAFLFLYLGSIWLVARSLIFPQSEDMRFLSWLSLFALVFTAVHGFFYDYLYNGMGTMFLLFPAGFSMIGVIDAGQAGHKLSSFPEAGYLWRKSFSPVKVLVPVLVIVALLLMNANKLISIWYSNLGAVQMSRTELSNFPSGQWATVEMVPQLKLAEASLRSALLYNPENQTANYRLGMISLLRQDFRPAVKNLVKAYHQAPEHRGIIKNLGYSYAWLGDIDKARFYLDGIPEAHSELEVYVWWWDTQGRQDLSANASRLATQIRRQADKP